LSQRATGINVRDSSDSDVIRDRIPETLSTFLALVLLSKLESKDDTLDLYSKKVKIDVLSYLFLTALPSSVSFLYEAPRIYNMIAITR
jgi:hypothetical protein